MAGRRVYFDTRLVHVLWHRLAILVNLYFPDSALQQVDYKHVALHPSNLRNLVGHSVFRIPNPRVVGSNPLRGTSNDNDLYKLSPFLADPLVRD